MESFGSQERRGDGEGGKEGGNERQSNPSWRGVRAEPGLQPPLGFPAAAAFPYPKTTEKGSAKLTSDGVNGAVCKNRLSDTPAV